MDVRMWCARVFLMIGCLACCARGERWYVDARATGEGDGHSWGSAWSSLQKTIDSAKVGDEIWIAGGEYFPENVRDWEGIEPFASSFELKDGIVLRGGFSGVETTCSQRELKDGAIYAWEFRSETVLAQVKSGVGHVLRLRPQRLEKGVVLDGVTVTGGKAIGAGEEGKGGGLKGSGVITVSNCQFRGNRAIHGGGIHWEGRLYMESSLIADNDVVTAGNGGRGGGAVMTGVGFCLSGVVVVGNGGDGGVMEGGGLYLDGCGTVLNCTVSGNQARRGGGGCWLGAGATLVNVIAWCNGQDVRQVSGVSGASVLYSAIEGGASGRGNVTLQHDNAGVHGIDGNDNSPDVYYVCFEAPGRRNFILGGGSYVIKRGLARQAWRDASGRNVRESGLTDMGACGTGKAGNLAVALSLEQPCLYGSVSAVSCWMGCGTPEGVSARLSAVPRSVTVAASSGLSWKVCWNVAGPVDLRLDVMLDGVLHGLWNDVHLVTSADVLPRPLVISADDAVIRVGDGSPPFTWSITGGRLIGKDSVEGALSCGRAGMSGGRRSIGQGTLHVNDGNGGRNYRLQFHDGELFEDAAED